MSGVRLLLCLAGSKYHVLDVPVIHGFWTSSAVEKFLDALGQLLAAVRIDALGQGGCVTLRYITMMFAVFVSAMGGSHDNRDITRPDWMHNIRSRRFPISTGCVLKAHQAGLTVFAVMGTDDLHVAGDWGQVFFRGPGSGRDEGQDRPRRLPR